MGDDESSKEEKDRQEPLSLSDAIIATVREPLVVLDKSLRIITANRSFYKTFLVSPENTEKQLIYDLGNRQWDIPELRKLLEDILPMNTAFEDFEVEHDFKSIGQKIMMLNARKIYTETDRSEMILLAIEDITERKKAEELIKRSLAEKDVLMKEINHRVKNNMAVVSSLLRLQSNKVEDEHYKAMFNDSINRINTMASIHEKLCQSEDLSKIIFSDYIKDMVNNIFKSYGLSSRIKLIVDVEEIILDIDASIPCGLIVNELITNSMKYAFPEGKEGEIRVSLCKNDKDEIELTVGDNGVGMPEGLDFRNADSLGLTLVNALVKQLEGKMELNKEKGTKFKITFRRC